MESQIACCIARGGENVSGCFTAISYTGAALRDEDFHLGIVDADGLSDATGEVAECGGAGSDQRPFRRGVCGPSASAETLMAGAESRWTSSRAAGA